LKKNILAVLILLVVFLGPLSLAFKSASATPDLTIASTTSDTDVHASYYEEILNPLSAKGDGDLRRVFILAPPSGSVQWTRQFGTSSDDKARGVALDGSGVYVVGETYGTFPGQYRVGLWDAFVRKCDTYGNTLWTRQFGTYADDAAFGVAVDGSGVYVVGYTEGTLPGKINLGWWDAFVRKYDIYGSVQWTRQFGTSSDDEVRGVAVDGSGVYVVGETWGTFPGQTRAGWWDAFVRKYDKYGGLKWTRQFGTSQDDFAFGVAVDGSGIYVVGYTEGILPGKTSAGRRDAFVRKYDIYGNALWTRQFGTSEEDEVRGVAVNPSGVFVAGYTRGTLPGKTSAGGADAFLRKYDMYGGLKWTRQFGTYADDAAFGVAVDSSGIYVAGETYGTFPGQYQKGSWDAFVRKCDMYGNALWTRQFGSYIFDAAFGVAVDGSGVYVVGYTEGTLPGKTSAGEADAFLRKYAP